MLYVLSQEELDALKNAEAKAKADAEAIVRKEYEPKFQAFFDDVNAALERAGLLRHGYYFSGKAKDPLVQELQEVVAKHRGTFHG